jgi:hypothetical protein
MIQAYEQKVSQNKTNKHITTIQSNILDRDPDK